MSDASVTETKTESNGEPKKSTLPPNVGALTDAVIDLFIKLGLGKELAELNASFTADTMNTIANRRSIYDAGKTDLQLGLCFFSDALRQWEMSRAFSSLFGAGAVAKLGRISDDAGGDISCYSRDAYRAAECFRRLGAKCDLRDTNGQIVSFRH